jgi:hypothetical protein
MLLSGVPVKGELAASDPSDDGPYDAYRFIAAAGDRVPLTLRGEAGFFPILVIGRSSPSGRFVSIQETNDGMYSDEAATSNTVFIATEAGTYELRAMSLLDREGPYVLTMGQAVTAPTSLVSRSPSAETLAAKAGGASSWGAYVASLDRDVADCEATPSWPGDCYDLLMEAAAVPRSVAYQWGGSALDPAEAAKTEAYARRAIVVARAAFGQTRQQAWGGSVIDVPDYRIPNAQHALGVHLLNPLVDRAESVAPRAAEAERLIRSAYEAASVHDLASGRRNLWPMEWLEHLAIALSLQGRQSEAVVVLNERMAAAERTWGNEHEQLYQYLPALAWGEMEAGDPVAAMATWRRAIALLAARGSMGRREGLDFRSGLAAAQSAAGDLTGALETYRSIQSEIANGPLVLESSIDGYVLGYADALQAAGRRQEALRFLEDQMQRAATITGQLPEVLTMGVVLAVNLLNLDRSGESAQILEAISPLAVRVSGAESVFALRVDSLLSVARARSGAVDQAQAGVDVLLPLWSDRAANNAALHAAALEAFGDLRVGAGRAREGRALLDQALPTELARWCPSYDARTARTAGRDAPRDPSCPGHPILTATISLRAAAALRDDGSAGAAARGYAHAGDMVVARTRARYRLHDDARREYARFRGVHARFVSTAWASVDRTVVSQLASRPPDEGSDLLTVVETLAALPSRRSRTYLAAVPII